MEEHPSACETTLNNAMNLLFIITEKGKKDERYKYVDCFFFFSFIIISMCMCEYVQCR